ncbi:hypothetical protein F3Y22_tig00111769pilonHSYRG00555 [Hibiscus syriacus]|uniref:Uncharacterized protein n=1 Tax=Hibiscus syriacus TaxID=106335 RepID=A0A6A2YDZ1_HIBSY|nr:hypothetical protein F3Y22_tig00111769pilonHSYRG00555 [Hibiscus syriacus]
MHVPTRWAFESSEAPSHPNELCEGIRVTERTMRGNPMAVDEGRSPGVHGDLQGRPEGRPSAWRPTGPRVHGDLQGRPDAWQLINGNNREDHGHSHNSSLLVVVFVLCLHLYAKWFWWRREEPTSHPSRRSRPRFVFAPGQDATHLQRGATKGLDSTILASLPALIFSQKTSKRAWMCGDEVNVQAQAQSPNDGHSMDSTSFPTNVLFWGNHTQVSSGASAAEVGSASTSIGSSTMTASSSGRQEHIFVIDVETNGNDNFTEEESKNPMPTRLRSLKRLLSREKRIVTNSPGTSSVDA